MGVRVRLSDRGLRKGGAAERLLSSQRRHIVYDWFRRVSGSGGHEEVEPRFGVLCGSLPTDPDVTRLESSFFGTGQANQVEDDSVLTQAVDRSDDNRILGSDDENFTMLE